MMVTVLNIGKKQITCYNCDSQLEYTQRDVQSYKTNYDYLGDFDIVPGIKCPVCSKILRTNK